MKNPLQQRHLIKDRFPVFSGEMDDVLDRVRAVHVRGNLHRRLLQLLVSNDTAYSFQGEGGRAEGRGGIEFLCSFLSENRRNGRIEGLSWPRFCRKRVKFRTDFTRGPINREASLLRGPPSGKFRKSNFGWILAYTCTSEDSTGVSSSVSVSAVPPCRVPDLSLHTRITNQKGDLSCISGQE